MNNKGKNIMNKDSQPEPPKWLVVVVGIFMFGIPILGVYALINAFAADNTPAQATTESTAQETDTTEQEAARVAAEESRHQIPAVEAERAEAARVAQETADAAAAAEAARVAQEQAAAAEAERAAQEAATPRPTAAPRPTTAPSTPKPAAPAPASSGATRCADVGTIKGGYPASQYPGIRDGDGDGRVCEK